MDLDYVNEQENFKKDSAKSFKPNVIHYYKGKTGPTEFDFTIGDKEIRFQEVRFGVLSCFEVILGY